MDGNFNYTNQSNDSYGQGNPYMPGGTPYQQYQQPYGQAPMGGQPYMGDVEEPVSLGDWLVSILLLCIPCINIVMIFVWAFGGSSKQAKANWARAMLIFTGIWLLLSFVFYASFGAVFADVMRQAMLQST